MMRPIGCPETSVRNSHYSQCNKPEECSSHLKEICSFMLQSFFPSHTLKLSLLCSEHVKAPRQLIYATHCQRYFTIDVGPQTEPSGLSCTDGSHKYWYRLQELSFFQIIYLIIIRSALLSCQQDKPLLQFLTRGLSNYSDQRRRIFSLPAATPNVTNDKWWQHPPLFQRAPLYFYCTFIILYCPEFKQQVAADGKIIFVLNANACKWAGQHCPFRLWRVTLNVCVVTIPFGLLSIILRFLAVCVFLTAK